MKASLNIFSIIIFLHSFLLTKAQGEAVISSLYLTPSVQSAGIGWTGVSFPGNDPFGFYYNPANLGYLSQYENVAIQFYPQRVKWLRNLLEEYEYNNLAVNLGYNFKKQFGNFNFSAGLGFIHSRFDHVSFFSPPPSEEIYDSYNAFGLGFLVDYYINFCFGITFKNIHAEKSLPVPDPFNKASTDVNAFDYGILINVPIMRFIDNGYFNISESSRLIPILNYNLGYSRLNIGDEITYDDPPRTNPLPLTARFGHTINLGFTFESGDLLIDFINYNMIFEADDILLERNDQGGLEYQGLFGDINIGKQFI